MKESAWLAAAKGGDLAQIEAMLSDPDFVGVNAVDKDGMTALLHAAAGGHSGVSQRLIKAKGRFTELDAATAYYGKTVLHFAAENGLTGVCEALLEAKGFTKVDAVERSITCDKG